MHCMRLTCWLGRILTGVLSFVSFVVIWISTICSCSLIGFIIANLDVFCAEIEVSGGQNGTPSPLVSIPGHLNPSSPGVKFNVFGTPGEQYPTLGPKVAAFGGKKARRGLTLDA